MREEAWISYFQSGNKELLIRAYSDSIKYMASQFYGEDDDLIQVGYMGLLKAIDKIDVNRVKSKDAWVFLNVRGAMINLRRFPKIPHLEDKISDELTLGDTLKAEEDWDIRIDLERALASDNPKENLVGYEPLVMKNHEEKVISNYKNGKISLSEVSRRLGISRRQAYKLTDTIPESW